jgi:hypothetical protein
MDKSLPLHCHALLEPRYRVITGKYGATLTTSTFPIFDNNLAENVVNDRLAVLTQHHDFIGVPQ